MTSLSFPKMLRSSFDRHSLPFWILAAFISLLFLMGGSSRADIQSLSIIRPVAVLVLGYGIWNLKREHVARYRFHFAFALALFGLTALHLVPLPPGVWQAVSGTNLVAEVSNVAGLPQIWQPISLAPADTWNALSALLAPIAVLVLVSQLDRESRFRLLAVFLILGLAGAVIGLLQATQPSDSPFYLYRIRLSNSPPGIFANRNHYAVFLSCIIPMLAVYLSAHQLSSKTAGPKLWIALAFCALLIPLILVTGSRAGLVTAILGISAAPFLYRKAKDARVGKGGLQMFSPRYLLVFAGIAAMALVTILAARAESFDRLLDDGGSADMRFAIWGPIWDMVKSYQPFGSGVGTFVPAYKIDEPVGLLTFQYFPHAHNDWLEAVLTAGLPGAVLMAVGGIAFVLAAWRNFRAEKEGPRDVMFARLGVIIIALLGLASIADFPLRVPSLGSLFVVAAIWAAGSNVQLSKRAGSA